MSIRKTNDLGIRVERLDRTASERYCIIAVLLRIFDETFLGLLLLVLHIQRWLLSGYDVTCADRNQWMTTGLVVSVSDVDAGRVTVLCGECCWATAQLSEACHQHLQSLRQAQTAHPRGHSLLTGAPANQQKKYSLLSVSSALPRILTDQLERAFSVTYNLVALLKNDFHRDR